MWACSRRFRVDPNCSYFLAAKYKLNKSGDLLYTYASALYWTRTIRKWIQYGFCISVFRI